jgi:hypothetical protein
MKLLKPLIGTAMLLCVSGAGAFECAHHFRHAKDAIDKVTSDMKGMAMMEMAQMKTVNLLLEKATAQLEQAEKTHESAKTPGEHALAIGMAEAAVGYAEAADIFHWKIMRK